MNARLLPSRPAVSRGFTLIELLIAVAMAAGVLMMGVPYLQSTAEGVRLNTAASAFQAATQLARSEAIKRGTRVAICAGSNGTCGTNWKAGWIVFTDQDRDCAINNATSEEIREGSGSAALHSASLATQSTGQAVTCIAYGSPGQVDGLSTGAVEPMTMTLCSPRGHSRVFDINRTGHIVQSKQTCTV
jgi:type IV fimbrial biogenesis protein FimT